MNQDNAVTKQITPEISTRVERKDISLGASSSAVFRPLTAHQPISIDTMGARIRDLPMTVLLSELADPSRAIDIEYILGEDIAESQRLTLHRCGAVGRLNEKGRCRRAGTCTCIVGQRERGEIV